MSQIQEIFLIDDDEDFCQQIVTFFGQHGLRTTYETNPLLALEHLQRHSSSFDLLISDYSMAPIDGFETIRRLRQFNQEIKVLLISAYVELDRQIVQELRIMGYLHKPLNLPQIVQRIKEI